MSQFRHSIQWRIFAYYTILICAAIGCLVAGFYFYEKKGRLQKAELEIQTKLIGMIPFYFSPNQQPGVRQPNLGLSSVSAGTGRGGPPIWQEEFDSVSREGQPAPKNAATLETIVENRVARFIEEDIYFYVEDDSGEVVQHTENFPAELLPISELYLERQNWVFRQTETQLYTVHQLPRRGTLIMGKTQAALLADLHGVLFKVIGMVSLVVAVVSFIGFWLIRYSLKPIKRIGQTAERIATGDISERIDVDEVESELGHLAGVLNTTFGRLGTALTRQIQFTSDASHELRTPVAAILADCQFSLKRERSPERYRETIEVCHESAQHMRSLIEDLRDLANFDEKNEELVSESVEMKEFLANVVSVMKPLATEKGIQLNAELESAVVELDPIRMRQAVLNLLGNAIRYTEAAGKVIVACAKKANTVIIEVRDTGIGIPTDKLDHVFDRFYRADEARSTHTGGVGLGLAISKSIVEANGGKISVESQVGVGTCFRIELAD